MVNRKGGEHGRSHPRHGRHARGRPRSPPGQGHGGRAAARAATVFREGHDQLGAEVVLVAPDGSRRPPVRMVADGDTPGPLRRLGHPRRRGRLDVRGAGVVRPARHLGARRRAEDPRRRRRRADVHRGRAAARPGRRRPRPLDAPRGRGGPRRRVGRPRHLAARGGPARGPAVARARVASWPRTRSASWSPSRAPTRCTPTGRARSSAAWYEFFPRSEGATYDEKTGTVVSGTFRTAAERLDAVAAMGFDVIYLPPIHPIGEVNRKGPNNTLDPGPTDPGSPWAIGSKDGGHDAIHPDLGTLDDFDAFVAKAAAVGLEVALDLALQCAPDHPWVTSHPEWFTTQADGTIAYAENPPKKYQDIYPLNFDNDPQGICREVLRVVRHWMSHGVRIFRVDNPHTKPVAFWEWLLREVRRTDPDVLFLAEAFTRPAMMQRPRRDRLPPELHLLHLAHRQVGDRGVPPRGVDPDRPPDAAELLRQHPRHPPRVPAVRRPAGVQDPRDAGGHRLAELGRVRRLRALRARRGAAGQRGVPRLREVPDPGPRLGGRRGRGPHPRAVPRQAQRGTPCPPRPAAAAQRRHPLQRRRERAGVQQAGRATTS